MIQDRRIALIFRAISFILILTGLFATIGIFRGEFHYVSFLYYTVQSNFLVLLLFLYLSLTTFLELHIKGKKGSVGFKSRFHMICVIDIFLTFFVYWVLLVPQSFSMSNDLNLWSYDNLMVHAIAPVLCFVDYILFSDSKHLKYKDTYLTLIYPIFYLAGMSILGLSGYTFGYDSLGKAYHYPYFFFDYDRVGLMSIVYIFALIILFIVISHLLYLLDKKWQKKIIYPKIKS